MIDLYEQQKGDKPFVMFNVTMQNRNPYTKKSYFRGTDQGRIFARRMRR